MPAEIQVAPLAPALIGAASALLVTMIAAGIGYWRFLREQAHEQETFLNALFGELANLYEHYSYAAHELPTGTSDKRELRLRLQWSMYGNVQATQNVTQYGFLSAGDIRLLLQLGLRIRNNDCFFEMLLANITAVGHDDLSTAKRRMQYAINTTCELIYRLVSNRPRLEKVLRAIENDLPSIPKVV